MTNLNFATREEKQVLEIDKLQEKCLHIDNLQVKLGDIEKKQERLDFGEFVWKIENFSIQRIKAQLWDETEIFSDPFYSHKNGYRMCLSVDPDGEYALEYGDKNNVHLGVYFYIMRGPLDNALQWPFRHSVTLALVDQQTGLDKYSDTTEYGDAPDHINWNKPTTEKNGPFGKCKFIERDSLLGNVALYTKDQIIIRCTVQINDNIL